MKKLILGLVLATLTLPAIALTIDQQAKLDNAWSILTANGVNPTVMKNELNFSFNSAKYNQGVYDENLRNFGNAFTSTNNIARQGKDSSLFNVNGGAVTSINNKHVEVYRNNVNYYYKKEGNTFATKKLSHMNSYYFKYYGNQAYNYLKAVDTSIITLSDKITDADIGGDVGNAIQRNGLRFKDTIGNLLRLEAAVELGKNVYPTCVRDSASIACTNLGFEMETLGQQIIFINPREHYIYNDQKWFINGDFAINEITNQVEHVNYLVGWNATYVPNLVTLDDYIDSVSDMTDIADAFILINDLNVTFGDLSDLSGNSLTQSTTLTGSEMSSLGM